MSALTGTAQLVRLTLRRDRIRLALWVVAPIVLAAVSGAQVKTLYGTPEKIQSYTSTFGHNPALVMFAGPGYGFNEPNIGVVLVNELSLWMALLCALMSVFLINRYTRAEEDSERADLLQSCVVGRHAPVTAALCVVGTANLAIALGAAVASVMAGYPVAGSMAMSLSFGAVGVVFAAATAVTAQIAGAGRASLALGAGSIGFAFVLRGIGDIRLTFLSWMTPFGWSLGVRAFAGERWWTLIGLAVVAVVLTLAAFSLSVRRDLGSGLLAQRHGSATANRWSTHPLGLVLRLQRTVIVGWVIGVFITGLVYGWIGRDVEKVLVDNPDLAKVLAQLKGASLPDSYLATALRLMALLAAGFAISSAMRNRSDEAAGFTEHMLSGSVGRTQWTLSHVAVSVGGAAAVVLSGGIGTGVGYAAAIHDGSQVLRLVGAAAVTLPAVLVMVGLTVFLFGWLPRPSGLAWAPLALIVVTTIFASMLHLPLWILEISPLEHTPSMPAEQLQVVPIVVLLLVSAGLVAVGLIGFRRRDVTPG